MGCSTCGGGSKVVYPREVMLPDGQRKTVTSAAEERVERDKAWLRKRAAERDARERAKRNGWSATPL